MNWKSVFDCYPDADKIFVVGDMPFLKLGEAEMHAKKLEQKVEVVTRASQYEDTTALEWTSEEKEAYEREAAKQAEREAAEKAKAEQEAADKARAEQEAADNTPASPGKPAKGKGKNK
ncbi:MAG: hypothetical protein LCH81_01040 [Bacteroidetes bacterium]|nr:hypothetical protein [Bacteroidota bacterium]